MFCTNVSALYLNIVFSIWYLSCISVYILIPHTFLCTNVSVRVPLHILYLISFQHSCTLYSCTFIAIFTCKLIWMLLGFDLLVRWTVPSFLFYLAVLLFLLFVSLLYPCRLYLSILFSNFLFVFILFVSSFWIVHLFRIKNVYGLPFYAVLTQLANRFAFLL